MGFFEVNISFDSLHCHGKRLRTDGPAWISIVQCCKKSLKYKLTYLINFFILELICMATFSQLDIGTYSHSVIIWQQGENKKKNLFDEIQIVMSP